ncbi:AAA family ATPase [Nonomuraea sp. NPDC000554]|uniref:AAA family ATPase n=1 Tax=Nonomuraea sp. NPDC000554 TaxID=3154259 RepID=UPI0033324D9A
MQNPISPSSPPIDPAVSDIATKAIKQSLTDIFDHRSNAKQTAFLNRVVDACNDWSHSRPMLTVVGGYAGSGKSEFSRFLSGITGWAFLDKDSMTCAMAERLLTALGGDPHDRHTELYLREVRPLEYRGLMESAFDNLRAGTSTILSAPFISELSDPDWVCQLTDRCAAMGTDVTVIWMHCDIESMRHRIEARRAARDAWKLANWDVYTCGLDVDNSPPAAHITIDNRLGTAISLFDQTRETLKRILA